jgi:NAD(P)-dependent dehydrogenase (short-subunit alcohol dehydrogenase family)
MDRKKNIFITGAASGIGRETALFFGQKGWFVGIVDVNEEGLLSLKSEIGEDNCCHALMDVTDLDSVDKAVKAFAEKTGGKMDVLFNNAGIASMGPNEDIAIEDQHKIVAVNFTGILNCIHKSLPYIKDTPGARIISMCSASAIYGIPELAVYSATKRAVKALTEALDIELEKYGITVSDILVPYVRTPLVTDADVKAFSIEKMGINVEPRQVAETVWKAAHGSKIHWHMTRALKLLLALFWIFPFAKRSIIKSQTTSPN